MSRLSSQNDAELCQIIALSFSNHLVKELFQAKCRILPLKMLSRVIFFFSIFFLARFSKSAMGIMCLVHDPSNLYIHNLYIRYSNTEFQINLFIGLVNCLKIKMRAKTPRKSPSFLHDVCLVASFHSAADRTSIFFL